jgi:hypothetical protein
VEKRVVTNFERNLTSGVNDIETIESQSYKVANFAARQASVDGIAHRCSITAGSPDQ